MTTPNTSTFNSPFSHNSPSTSKSSNPNTTHNSSSSKSSPTKPQYIINHNNNNHNTNNNQPPQKLKAGQLRHHEIEHFFTSEKDVVRNSEPLSWSNCDATTFHVRRGPNYISGQKTPSQKAIYEVFAIDSYSNTNKINFFQQFLDIDEHVKNYREKYNYRYHRILCPLPPIVVVNIMVPNYAPEMTTNKCDGDGFQMVLCAQLTEDVRKFYQKRYQKHISKYIQNNSIFSSSSSTNNNTPATTNSPSLSTSSSSSEIINDTYKNCNTSASGKCLSDDDIPSSFSLLSNFVHSDLTDKNNNPLRNRFKCIARVMNTDSSGFNFLTKRLVQQYNGRPFLARTSSTFYHKIGEYFSADIDVHLFGYPARKGLHYVKSTISQMIFDLAMVIEGHTDNELPEQVLCCARISNVGVDTALKFPEYLQQYYNDKKGDSGGGGKGKDEEEEDKNDDGGDSDVNGESGGGGKVGDGGEEDLGQQQMFVDVQGKNKYSYDSKGKKNGRVKNGYLDNHLIGKESSLDKIFGVFAWGGSRQ